MNRMFGAKSRRVLAGAVMAAMLIGTAAATNAITRKMIEVEYANIKLVVDGVEVIPTDAEGNVVEPFISNGTTYLPVRAVGKALNKEVTWDGATKTVYLGQVPGTETNWMKELPPYQLKQSTVYDGTDPRQSFSVAGVTHTVGIEILDIGGSDGHALWNTNCHYNTMTFTIGTLDNASWDGTLEVYLDGVYSTEYELKWDAAPKTISIPLNAAPNVKLVVTNGYWGLYDVSFS